MTRYANVDRLMKHAISLDWSILKWVNEVDICSAINPNVIEQKRGKWIEIKRNDVNPLTGRRGVYVGCSECGCPIPTDSQLDYIDESEALFCFACGANMREDGEQDEL